MIERIGNFWRKNGTSVYYNPGVDSVTALQVNKADGTTNVLNVDTTNGRVGIGTIAPSEKLQIDTSLINSLTTSLRLVNTAGGNDSGTKIGWSFAIVPAVNPTYIAMAYSTYGDATRAAGFEFATGGGGINGNAEGTVKMVISGLGKVGIGTTSPTGNLSVSQTATATGALKGIVYTGAVNTNQTLSTEIPSLTLTTAGREWATGALTLQREVLITQPTYTFVGASTITDAATVGIAGAPIKSTNATITNTHAILVQAGAVSTATNSFGLTVNAQTGATNNYVAAFLGGNVGIGTAAPAKTLDVVGTFKASTSIQVGTAAGYLSSDGSAGATGTFTTVDLKTVTVKDGIITAIV